VEEAEAEEGVEVVEDLELVPVFGGWWVPQLNISSCKRMSIFLAFSFSESRITPAAVGICHLVSASVSCDELS